MLDGQTLYLFNAMGLCVIAGLVAIAAASYPPSLRRSGWIWAAATLAQGIGMASIGLREQIPVGISVLAAHVLGVGGLAGYHHALERFRGASARAVLYYLAVPAALGSSVYFYWLAHDYAMRVAIFSSLAAFELGLCAYASWQARTSGAPWTGSTASIGFGVAALLLLSRIQVVKGVDAISPPETILHQSFSEQMIILILMLLFFYLAFSFVMLSNERINDELRHLAHYDPLTGCRNRRGVRNSGEREVARARRAAHPVSVALVDLDHLKQINDRMGHATGDAALVHVGRCLRAALRKVDVAGRWGGDEFLVVLPDTDPSGAEHACERIRLEVLKPSPELPGALECSVTIGVATAEGNELEFEELVATADVALYEAKALGRNRVSGTTHQARPPHRTYASVTYG